MEMPSPACRLLAGFFGIGAEEYNVLATNGLIPFGRIVRPHGLRGEVKLDLLSSLGPVDLLDCCALFSVSTLPYEGISRLAAHGSGQALMAVDGVTNIDAAKALVGTILSVAVKNVDPRAAFIEHFPLLGCKVLLPDSSPYGTVVGFFNFGAGVVVETYVDGIDDTVFFPVFAFQEREPGTVVVTMAEFI